MNYPLGLETLHCYFFAVCFLFDFCKFLFSPYQHPGKT